MNVESSFFSGCRVKRCRAQVARIWVQDIGDGRCFGTSLPPTGPYKNTSVESYVYVELHVDLGAPC